MALLLGASGVSLALFSVTEGWRRHLASVAGPGVTVVDRVRVLRERGSLALLLRVTMRRCGTLFAIGAGVGLLMRPVVVPVVRRLREDRT